MKEERVRSILKKYSINQKDLTPIVGIQEGAISKWLSSDSIGKSLQYLPRIIEVFRDGDDMIDPPAFDSEKYDKTVLENAADEFEALYQELKNSSPTEINNVQQGNDNRFNESSVIEKMVSSHCYIVKKYADLLTEQSNQISRLLNVIEKNQHG